MQPQGVDQELQGRQIKEANYISKSKEKKNIFYLFELTIGMEITD